jgi:hypothetical protein
MANMIKQKKFGQNLLASGRQIGKKPLNNDFVIWKWGSRRGQIWSSDTSKFLEFNFKNN